MSLKKTKTIKERLIYVYLPSQKMVDAWKGKAKDSGTSISKMVIEYVENGICQEKSDYIPRVDLIKQNKVLKGENDTLRDDNTKLKIVIDKLQEDLQTYRLQPFMDNQFDDMRKFEQRLTDLLRKKKFVRTDDVWRELRINPQRTDMVKAISHQLKLLEDYGIIKHTYEGWRWIA